MRRFVVTFSCRTIGAIGISYPVDFGPIVADDPKEAEELGRWLAYNTHEHLHLFRILEEKNGGWYDKNGRYHGPSL